MLKTNNCGVLNHPGGLLTVGNISPTNLQVRNVLQKKLEADSSDTRNRMEVDKNQVVNRLLVDFLMEDR